MATITLSVTSVANGTLSKTYTVTEMQFAQWVAAIKVYAGPGPLGQPMTDAQALLSWANATFGECVITTQRDQQRIASAAIAPISSST